MACCTSTTSRLQMALRHRVLMMLSFVVVLGATLYMFVNIPKGFIPDQDTDQLTVITEAAQGTSYYQMVELRAADRRDRGRRSRTWNR